MRSGLVVIAVTVGILAGLGIAFRGEGSEPPSEFTVAPEGWRLVSGAEAVHEGGAAAVIARRIPVQGAPTSIAAWSTVQLAQVEMAHFGMSGELVDAGTAELYGQAAVWRLLRLPGGYARTHFALLEGQLLTVSCTTKGDFEAHREAFDYFVRTK